MAIPKHNPARAIRGTGPKRLGLTVLGLASLLSLPAAALQAGGLPPNPQRPFTAQTCSAALARLAEAEAGSPLISAAENEQVLVAACRQAKRLCDAPLTEPQNE